MNYQQKYKKNLNLLHRYADFLPFCTTVEQRIKLACEIARLQNQNEHIAQMGYLETLKDSNDYFITI
ncbi:MAG: hypothetical protein AB7D46_00710 [Flavobacteriaceae bacterium]